MSLGEGIILNGQEPKGRFMEGTITDTSLPGTIMEVVPATEPLMGRYSFRAASIGSDGDARPQFLLLPDHLQGGIATQAYTAGRRGYLYVPLPGDDLNLLMKNISGTSDHFAIGDAISISNNGKGIAATGASKPYIMMETQAAGLTVDTLLHVQRT